MRKLDILLELGWRIESLAELDFQIGWCSLSIRKWDSGLNLLICDCKKDLLRLLRYRCQIYYAGKFLLMFLSHSRNSAIVFFDLLDLAKSLFVIPPFCCNSLYHNQLAKLTKGVILVNPVSTRIAAIFDNFPDKAGEVSKMLFFKVLKIDSDNIPKTLVFGIDLFILVELVDDIFTNKSFISCLQINIIQFDGGICLRQGKKGWMCYGEQIFLWR